MEKINKTWLKNNGFKESVYENTEERSNHMQEVIKKKQTIHELYFPDKWARFDSYYTIITNKFGDKKISRYYMFSAANKKTGFFVENRISHYLPTIEQINAALKVVGIN